MLMEVDIRKQDVLIFLMICQIWNISCLLQISFLFHFLLMLHSAIWILTHNYVTNHPLLPRKSDMPTRTQTVDYFPHPWKSTKGYLASREHWRDLGLNYFEMLEVIGLETLSCLKGKIQQAHCYLKTKFQEKYWPKKLMVERINSWDPTNSHDVHGFFSTVETRLKPNNQMKFISRYNHIHNRKADRIWGHPQGCGCHSLHSTESPQSWHCSRLLRDCKGLPTAQ